MEHNCVWILDMDFVHSTQQLRIFSYMFEKLSQGTNVASLGFKENAAYKNKFTQLVKATKILFLWRSKILHHLVSYLTHFAVRERLHNYVSGCPYSCGKIYSFTFSLYKRVQLVSYYRQNGSITSLLILKLSIIFIISPCFKFLLFSHLQLGTTSVLGVEISLCFVSASG